MVESVLDVYLSDFNLYKVLILMTHSIFELVNGAYLKSDLSICYVYPNY